MLNVKSKKFSYWRQRIIISSFCGYVLFYFLRKSFVFVMPAISKELYLTSAAIGLLNTILYISYGFSKVFNSFLIDVLNPRYFMVTGLLFTCIFTICISLSNSYTYLVLFCCVTGWFQGFGWPAVTKQLTHWFSKQERGFWWGLCSTSHTIGGALSALVCGFLVKYFGWRFSIYAPTLLCLLLCFILLERLRGTPKSLNLPTATEHYIKYRKPKKVRIIIIKKRSKNMYVTQIIKNKFIWLLSIAYLFTYAVKTAINDWTILYLVNQKEYTLTEACTTLFWFEVGGLLGIYVTGTIVGSLCKKKKIVYLLTTYVALIGSLILLYVIPHIKLHVAIILLTLIGFLIFSPQMLIGLIATESTDIKIACAANGFVSGWAYVGAAITGYPLGLLLGYSWDNLFIFLLTCSLLTLYPLLILLKRLTTQIRLN